MSRVGSPSGPPPGRPPGRVLCRSLGVPAPARNQWAARRAAMIMAARRAAMISAHHDSGYCLLTVALARRSGSGYRDGESR
eukprot:505329-Hanusia_phi.AAC.1